MKSTKEQKAITLIALIITIVVLLILAVVAISSITNDGILSYATNAATDYNKAVANESTQLGEYVNFLKNEINPVKIITFTIAGTSYQAEEGMTWIQWVSSSYNTMNITCNSSESTPELYEKDGVFTMIAYYYDSSTDEIMHEEGEKASSNLDWLTGKNKITAGVTYLTEELG